MESIEFTDREKEVILTLASHNMSVAEASREIFLHRNTVIY